MESKPSTFILLVLLLYMMSTCNGSLKRPCIEDRCSSAFDRLRKIATNNTQVSLPKAKRTFSMLSEQDLESPDQPHKVLVANYTGNPRRAPLNNEQLYNRKTDKIRLLYSYANNDQEVSYIYPGHECNFERTCVWKWKNVSDGFVIEEAGRSKLGPKHDADNNTSGKTSIIVLIATFHGYIPATSQCY